MPGWDTSFGNGIARNHARRQMNRPGILPSDIFGITGRKPGGKNLWPITFIQEVLR
ncbi:hypothetical protein LptCag_1081 [Leptospirillum ferriphilum]|uniref:Uncharacterized protein n=1 Tax=Leptospirillum ferriphilum TaxID=178606 RepID=A0A094W9U5_9BACT|nr:hypothetical protein LptCag_1081 [Leptospirillum ferriphilum]